MRLYSSVIKLINLHPVTLTHIGGQHAHAAFLDIVRAVDESLSRRLHDLNGRKPFTVSPLMGLPRSSKHEGHKGHEGRRKKESVDSVRSAVKNEIHVREGWECWLRVTMLDEGLFKSFIDYFMTSPPTPLLNREGRIPAIRLGDAHFLVSEILTTPGSHPWAGYTTLDELQKRLDEPAPQSITLEFHSPTSFKLQNDDIETVPYPKLLFGNLANAWKALTGENMVEAVEKYAAGHVRPVLHRLERRVLTMRNHPELGIVGRVEYQFHAPEDTPLARALNLLADLAFYSGTGRKTAQGMGMVRRIESL